jgi:hypothetical protein
METGHLKTTDGTRVISYNHCGFRAVYFGKLFEARAELAMFAKYWIVATLVIYLIFWKNMI